MTAIERLNEILAKLKLLESDIEKATPYGVMFSTTEFIGDLPDITQQLETAIIEQEDEQRKAKAFYDYFRELYGEGLEVANWHQNGDTEPFDNFFDSAEQETA